MAKAVQVPDPVAADNLSEHQKQEFRALHLEKMRRDCEALKLYEPLPFQEAFHAK